MDRVIVGLFLLSLLIFSSMIILNPFPFVYDEGAYALMVKEFSAHPSMVEPTIAGEHVEWKPPLFTWGYSAFYDVLGKLPLSVETQFRLPSALFGAADVVLVYMIGALLYGRKIGIAAAFLFLTTPLVLFSSITMMMESFSLFLALSSIYLYLSGNLPGGSILLGLIVLTKWLYVLMPALFIALYFLKDKRLPSVLASFLSIPFFLLIRLLVAFYFGNIDNAVLNLSFDLLKPASSLNPLWILYNYSAVFMILPLSWLFLFSLASFKIDLRKEIPIISVCLLAFLLPLSSLFIFWYLIIIAPMLALFVSARIIQNSQGMSYPLVIAFMVMNLAFTYGFLFSPMFISGPYDVPRVASFMQNKSVAFVEPQQFYDAWGAANRLYANSTESFLLLEQFNPGILYYRFSSADDYPDLRAYFGRDASALPCRDYLVVHDHPGINVTVPSCFRLLWSVQDYSAYSAIR
jgi:4-amino-4-deoxy-L-arabinose transferase-like glycosyltransferase